MFHNIKAVIFGRQSSGTNTEVAVDSLGNILLAGSVAADAVDTGNPVKVGGVARTTNPTAVADGDRVSASFDDLGRQLVIPFQVRDLHASASATLTTGTAATLLAGEASTFHDLLHVSFANNSTVAASVVLLADGSNVKTIQVPASSTLSIDFTTPYPHPVVATNWSADMEDITGTTVVVDALFIKNI